MKAQADRQESWRRKRGDERITCKEKCYKLLMRRFFLFLKSIYCIIFFNSKNTD